jgi:hypothetical protein
MILADCLRAAYARLVKRLLQTAVLVGLGLLCTTAASAQTSTSSDVVYEENTVLTFGDDTIDGSLSRPDGQYLESRKRLRHERLIRVRRSFRSRLLHSIHGLK